MYYDGSISSGFKNILHRHKNSIIGREPNYKSCIKTQWTRKRTYIRDVCVLQESSESRIRQINRVTWQVRSWWRSIGGAALTLTSTETWASEEVLSRPLRLCLPRQKGRCGLTLPACPLILHLWLGVRSEPGDQCQRVKTTSRCSRTGGVCGGGGFRKALTVHQQTVASFSDVGDGPVV